MSHPEIDWKKEKEAWVSNRTGTSVWQLSLTCLVMPVSPMLVVDDNLLSWPVMNGRLLRFFCSFPILPDLRLRPSVFTWDAAQIWFSCCWITSLLSDRRLFQ